MEIVLSNESIERFKEEAAKMGINPLQTGYLMGLLIRKQDFKSEDLVKRIRPSDIPKLGEHIMSNFGSAGIHLMNHRDKEKFLLVVYNAMRTTFPNATAEDLELPELI